MTKLCQIEILNLASTQIDKPPSHPQGGVQIYPSANLLQKNSDFDFLDICAKDKYKYGTRTRTVEDDLGELS